MVLFTSCKPLQEAANIRTVYEAYKGEKMFEMMNPRRDNLRHTLHYDLLVTDEIPKYSTAPVLMICHGASGGKTYGLDQPYPYVSKSDTELLTYILSTSKETTPYVASWARCDESKVIPLGMPRMDMYEGKKKGDGGTLLKNKKAYLFCPTYRTREEGSLPWIDWGWLDNQLTYNEILAVKYHPATTNAPKLDGYRHICSIPAEEPSAPYLMDCDVLITDYSTIMFDAHVLQKPVVLFEKDWERYNAMRGMYMKYPGMYSSYHCRSERVLINMVRCVKRTKQDERIRQYVCSACDGHSTERVIAFINRVCPTEGKNEEDRA